MRILGVLTKRHILENKKRSLVTLIGITLTSALLFIVGFIYGTYNKQQIESASKSTGLYDAIYEDLSFDNKEVFNNDDVLKYEYVAKLYDTDIVWKINAGSKLEEEKKAVIYAISDDFEFKYFKGNRPNSDSELVISSYIASLINVNLNDKYVIEITDLDGKKVKKEYTIVGIYNVDLQARYQNSPEMYTKEEIKNEKVNFYVYLKNKNNAYSKLESMAESLNLERIPSRKDIKEYKNLKYNQSLLSVYGNYEDNQRKAIIYVSLMLILTVISIFCATLIYNSFAISLMERIKQIGMLKSIGTTNHQVRKMIFKEALYLSIIAIPLGFILSYILTYLFILIINHLLINIDFIPYKVFIYPNYILICLVFIILTILYSSFFPSIQATMMTPIEAIKGNKSIKSKYKRKPNKLISKIFKIEGLIAYNSIKRSKSKYRITIFAITVSFILFMTIVTFINFTQKQLLSSTEISKGVSGYSKDVAVIDEIVKLDSVKDYMIYNIAPIITNRDKINNKYQNDTKDNVVFYVTLLNKEKNEEVKKEFGITNDNPIVINNYNVYDENGKVKSKDKIFTDDKGIELCSFDYTYDELNKGIFNKKDCLKRDFNLINEVPKTLSKFSDNMVSIIVNEEIFDRLKNLDNYNYFYLLSDDYVKIDEQIKEKYTNEIYDDFSYSNYSLDNYKTFRTLLVVKIILYSLIILFSLIAITSIVNTIVANMALRKREFAILKSVGLDDKKFNKMLLLEGMFLSIRSLMYSVPLSLLVTYLIRNIFNISIIDTLNKYSFKDIFAFDYFVLGIIVIVIVINLTIYLATRNFKDKNIIEDVKNENV